MPIDNKAYELSDLLSRLLSLSAYSFAFNSVIYFMLVVCLKTKME